jgi:hypothetical protein
VCVEGWGGWLAGGLTAAASCCLVSLSLLEPSRLPRSRRPEVIVCVGGGGGEGLLWGCGDGRVDLCGAWMHGRAGVWDARIACVHARVCVHEGACASPPLRTRLWVRGSLERGDRHEPLGLQHVGALHRAARTSTHIHTHKRTFTPT